MKYHMVACKKCGVLYLNALKRKRLLKTEKKEKYTSMEKL